MKNTNIIMLAAAFAAVAVFAADQDLGKIITDGNIADVAGVTNAGDGTATVSIKDNTGTANSVTVYNKSTMDTALAGKASTGDVSALASRATALETATNNLTTAVGQAASAAASAATDAANAYANATNNAAQTYVKKSGDTMTGTLSTTGTDVGFHVIYTPNNKTFYRNGKIIYTPAVGTSYELIFPTMAGTLALMSDVSSATNTLWGAIPSWAKADTKPSYNFSELGGKPTTLAGYGITDAAIANGTITLGANTITPVTTETDPVWAAEKSGYVQTTRKVAGMELTDNITLKSLSIVGASTSTYNGSAAATVNNTTATLESTTNGGTTGKNLTVAVAATSVDFGAYYIKIGTDGKPHLMLRK